MNANRRKCKKVDEASSLVALLIAVVSLSSCGPKLDVEPKDFWVPNKLSFSISSPGGTIHVGDHYQVTFTAIYPTNGVVTFPEIGKEKDIVVLDRQWQEVPFDLEKGHKKEEVKYTITSFRLGEHVICDQPVLYQHEGITETNSVPDDILKVVSSLDEDASSKLADIKPVQKLPGRIPPWLWLTLGIAATAFAIGLVSSKLWKHRETLVPKAPPIPPHIIALKALEALKAKGLLEKDECNPFYTELSVILRTYLEGRFHLNAPDETTEEIVEEMSRSPELNGSQRNILQEFMRQADMVKFAKGHPDRSTMETAFDTTKQFIDETKLVGEAVPQIENQHSGIENSK